MNKLLAILLSLLLTFIIAADFYLINSFTVKELDQYKVTRVIDGDTLELDSKQTVRLVNINTPEKGSGKENLSIDFMKYYVNKTLSFKFIGEDKYNRILAKAFYNSKYLNLILVEKGYSSKFLVQEDELKEFSRAEQYAIENGLGIWKKSIYFGCFDILIKEKEEQVYLSNKCEKINLANWKIKDESRKEYIFPTTLSKNLILSSKQGKDNISTLFWNERTDIWNNDRDSAYLFDSKGNIAGYTTYGY